MKARIPESDQSTNKASEEQALTLPDLPIVGVVIGGRYTYHESRAMSNPVTVYGLCQDLGRGDLQVHFVDANEGHWVTDCNTFLGLFKNSDGTWVPKFTYIRPEATPDNVLSFPESDPGQKGETGILMCRQCGAEMCEDIGFCDECCAGSENLAALRKQYIENNERGPKGS